MQEPMQLSGHSTSSINIADEAILNATEPRSYQIQPTVEPHTLVVHCGDPRFQEPIRRFLTEELGLKSVDYVPLVVGGGVAPLTEPFTIPKDAKYVREQMQFYAEHFGSIQRVVLINHEDCGKYKAMTKALPTMLSFVKNIPERQRQDLIKVGLDVTGFMPRRLEVEKYYARFANKERTQIVFDKQ